MSKSSEFTKFQFKLSLLTKAISQLEKAINQPKTEFIRDAVIQRFEFTYELSWKTLKAYLETLDLIVLNPKETLKVAHQQGLLSDADAWSELHQKRNLTSHTYDEKLAEDIYSFIQSKGLKLFIQLKNKLITL